MPSGSQPRAASNPAGLPEGTLVGGPREIWVAGGFWRVFRYDVKYRRRTFPAYVYIHKSLLNARSRSLSRATRRTVASRGGF
jgi:hypothetical protein